MSQTILPIVLEHVDRATIAKLAYVLIVLMFITRNTPKTNRFNLSPTRRSSPMQKATLRVIRGLPGSGKTTLATFAAANRSNVKIVTTESDNKGCDEACRRQVLAALEQGDNVVLHNLFLRHKSTLAYQFIAKTAGAEYDVVDLYDAGLTDAELAQRTKRPDVDEHTINTMRSQYQR